MATTSLEQRFSRKKAHIDKIEYKYFIGTQQHMVCSYTNIKQWRHRTRIKSPWHSALLFILMAAGTKERLRLAGQRPATHCGPSGGGRGCDWVYVGWLTASSAVLSTPEKTRSTSHQPPSPPSSPLWPVSQHQQTTGDDAGYCWHIEQHYLLPDQHFFIEITHALENRCNNRQW